MKSPGFVVTILSGLDLTLRTHSRMHCQAGIAGEVKMNVAGQDVAVLIPFLSLDTWGRLPRRG